MGLWIVTGANGHLGNLVVRALVAAGHPVRALVHERRPALADLADAPGLSVGRLELRDPDAVQRAFEGAEGVVHLAARISLEARDGEEMLAINEGGTHNVVAACRRRGLRLIHLSSIHAFDPQPTNAAVDEARPLAIGPRHFVYDRSKALGEAAVRAAEDLDAVILNPTAMLGPEDHGPSELGLLVRRLLTRTLPGLIAADFDWVDARDVADQIVRLVGHGPRRGRWLLTGARLGLPELCRAICAAGGVAAPRMVSPLWLAQATAPFAVGWARLRKTPPLYTSASLRTLAHYRVVDGRKARDELAWSPRPLSQTISDTVAWWRTRLP